MKVYYSDHFPLPLPDGHRFPGEKYRMLRELLVKEAVLLPSELHAASLAEWGELERVHDGTYLDQVRTGNVNLEQWKRTGFPWSPQLVDRCRATVGGLLAAVDVALESSFSGNLAGGTHHAHRNRGEGYCVFNDIAVAARKLLDDRKSERIAVVDLDVHQGNGTATIFSEEPRVYTFSVHGKTNYPFQKEKSTLDIPLPEGTKDEEFLAALKFGMEKVEAFGPDFVFFQMGVDGLKEDKLGKWSLTHAGLMERDRRVLEWCHRKKVPVVLALGGGYGEPLEVSVRAYANTYRVAKEVFGG